MSYFRQYLLVLMFSLFVTSLHANEKECFEKQVEQFLSLIRL